MQTSEVIKRALKRSVKRFMLLYVPWKEFEECVRYTRSETAKEALCKAYKVDPAKLRHA